MSPYKGAVDAAWKPGLLAQMAGYLETGGCLSFQPSWPPTDVHHDEAREKQLKGREGRQTIMHSVCENGQQMPVWILCHGNL